MSYAAAIIKAMQSDATLATILGSDRRNGAGISYLGLRTRYSHSLAMDCDVELIFVVHYYLNPKDL